VDLTQGFGSAEIAMVSAAFIHTIVYVCFVWIVSTSGAVFACQVAYIVTISGVFISAIFLDESYSGWVWLALVLMLCGLAMVQPRDIKLEAKTV